MGLMDQKGFIHVLEAILISLVVVATLPFLLFPVERTANWEVAQLRVMGEDALAAADETSLLGDNGSLAEDILEGNATSVDSGIRSILGTSQIGYGVNIRGSLKNRVRIGCNCSQEEVRKLRQTLTPTQVNGRRIIFRVFSFPLDDWSRRDFDVVIANGSSQVERLNDFYNESRENRELLLDHLRKGHGLVEMNDMDTVTLDEPLQDEVFGLAAGSGTSGKIGFVNRDNVSRDNYYIGKYFYGTGTDRNFTAVSESNLTLQGVEHGVRKNTDGGTWDSVDIDTNANGTYDGDEMDFGEGDRFNVSLDGVRYNLTVDRIDSRREVVHFNFRRRFREYNFSDFVSDDPAAVSPGEDDAGRTVVRATGGRDGAVLNEIENGRTVWISKGTGDDYRGLLKATVLWAAGEDWHLLPRSVTSRQVQVSYYVSQGEEFFEPYWIEMTLWRLF